MRKSRIFLIVAAVLVLVIGGAIVYVLTNINSIVKGAIEKYGSQATKTDVRVSSVKIGLSSGEASVTRLAVANPRGFSAPNIFSLGNISTRIDGVIRVKSFSLKLPDLLLSMMKMQRKRLDPIDSKLSISQIQKL